MTKEKIMIMRDEKDERDEDGETKAILHNQLLSKEKEIFAIHQAKWNILNF